MYNFFLFLKGCNLSVRKSNSSFLIVYNSFCRQLHHIACSALKLVEYFCFVRVSLGRVVLSGNVSVWIWFSGSIIFSKNIMIVIVIESL